MNFMAKVEEQASTCKQQYPEALIIVVDRVVLRDDLYALKDAELASRNTFNEKMDDQLAQDIQDVVNYIECSFKPVVV